jgi:hypothetical protein
LELEDPNLVYLSPRSGRSEEKWENPRIAGLLKKPRSNKRLEDLNRQDHGRILPYFRLPLKVKEGKKNDAKRDIMNTGLPIW